MRYGRMAGGLLALAALTAGGKVNAQITPQGGGYLFRHKFTAGQKTNYVMSVNTAVAGTGPGAGSHKAQSNLTMSVLSVQNGVASVEVTSDGLVVDGRSAQKGQNTTLKIDSRGQVSGADSERGAAPMIPQAPVFPQGPVKIGATFASAAGANKGGALGDINAMSTFRLVGFKIYNGQKVAQLSVSANASGGIGGTASGFMLISEATGELVSSRMDSNMSFGQKGKSANIALHMRVERK